MAKRTKRNIVDDVMNEAIPMPGAPQLIVTRGWAYQWLKRMGYNTDPRAGFASVDYMVFGNRRLTPVNEPLTDLEQPWAKNLIATMERHCQEAA